jgi:hypothetical protein
VVAATLGCGLYTPINDIRHAKLSASDGIIWNEQLKTDKAFVTALKQSGGGQQAL